ncbi:MAG TPA: T9SS type A sorting domain-containing protein [Aquaticitalea sp.]|nr:T9SS type A sorting domain-containing protein [Aquaticitalea sp.]
MKKNTLILVLSTILSTGIVYSQSGNTINDAIDLDGIGVGLNLLDFNSATASGLMPVCSTSADVFYKHTISSGDNKLTVGMSTVAITISTDMEYQLFRAPGGNLDGLEELTCDAYTVVILVGGGYEQVIENVVPDDVYYLRVFKPSGLGGLLTGLLNGTSITMVSTFDGTLSIGDIDTAGAKIVVDDNYINLYDNTNYRNFKIYGLHGKQIVAQQTDDFLNEIDISRLTGGFYILLLENEQGHHLSYKFIKH